MFLGVVGFRTSVFGTERKSSNLLGTTKIIAKMCKIIYKYKKYGLLTQSVRVQFLYNWGRWFNPNRDYEMLHLIFSKVRWSFLFVFGDEIFDNEDK